MQRFILKTILLSLPLLLVLVVVNYVGDAAKLFNADYERKMVNILNTGRFVTNIENYDERIFQKELLLSRSELPEIVVIGSSRTMLITQDLFPDKTFLNSSVSGANLKDLISIYQLHKENNPGLNEIILGVDPWMFNNQETGARWKSLAKYYHSFKAESSRVNFLSNDSKYKWSQLFSLSYFQASTRSLGDKLQNTAEPIPTDQRENRTNTILLDGSLVYGEPYRTAPQNQVDTRISKYLEGEIYGMKGFSDNYTAQLEVLKELCDDMLQNNIQVSFFLSPYPPASFAALVQRYPALVSLEKSIREYAIHYNVNVIGSFNPDNYGLNKTDFYDGMHCKERVVIKLLEMNSKG